ncbi:hypothetical protein [Streptomyces sp. NPDC048269]
MERLSPALADGALVGVVVPEVREDLAVGIRAVLAPGKLAFAAG